MQSPGHKTESASKRAEIRAYKLEVKDKGHHAKAKAKGKGKGKSGSSSTSSGTDASKSAAYRKAVAVALASRSDLSGSKSHSKKKDSHKRSAKTGKKVHKTKHRTTKATTSTTGSSLAAPTRTTLTPDVATAAAATRPRDRRRDNVVTAPSAPVLTGATSGQPDARLTWTEPTDTGSTRITGYNVYAGTSPGGEYPVAVNGSRPVSGRSYVVTHLTAGSTYYFTVRAINRVGLSAPSNEASATPAVIFQSIGALSAPVVAMASTPDGRGYWMANSSGAIWRGTTVRRPTWR